MVQDREKMLYLMHVSWYWIKQRPHFIAENLSNYFNITVVFTEKFTPDNRLINSKKPFFVKSIKILSPERFNFIRGINERIIKNRLKKQIKYVHLIWLTNPYYYELIENYIKPTQIVIYDCMDDILEFPYIKSNYILSAKYFEKEQKLILRSNVIFVSSQNLMLKIKSRYKISCNPILLNNAISSTIFTESKINDNLIINDLPSENGFIDLLYIGTISMWFDFELLLQSLVNFQQIRYILIGPKEIEIPMHKRIIYLGCKKHIELIPYMEKADSLVMPFVVNDLIKSVNPVKLYEYIHSGKSIIVCNYSEMDQFDDFVYRYNSENEYFQLLKKLINKELIQKDIKRCHVFTVQNTWEKRIEVINSYLFPFKQIK